MGDVNYIFVGLAVSIATVVIIAVVVVKISNIMGSKFFPEWEEDEIADFDYKREAYHQKPYLSKVPRGYEADFGFWEKDLREK